MNFSKYTFSILYFLQGRMTVSELYMFTVLGTCNFELYKVLLLYLR